MTVDTHFDPDARDISDYFELSYGTHLVVETDRLAAAGVLDEIQAMMDELARAYAHYKVPAYRAVPARFELVGNLTAADMEATGITRNRLAGLWYDEYGNELTRHDHVYVPVGEPLHPSQVVVAPRTLLQSMPQEWQHRLVALLDKAEERNDDISYSVQAGEWHGDTFTPYADDPVPHYARGRTYIEPRLGS